MLPEGMTLSDEDRAWLRAEAARLRQAAAPSADAERAIAAELLGLFAAFLAQPISAASAEARGRHYLDAVAGFPVEALRTAIALWMRGEEAGPHDNHAFPPSPPQLVRLLRIATAPLHRQVARLEALAAAGPAPRKPTPAERARVEAMLAALRRPQAEPIGGNDAHE